MKLYEDYLLLTQLMERLDTFSHKLQQTVVINSITVIELI